MDIDNLTLGQIKQIQALLSNPTTPSTQSQDGLNAMLGKKVIIRTYSAGVWFGRLKEKSGNEVILTEARRMWRWWAKESISLSGVGLFCLVLGFVFAHSPITCQKLSCQQGNLMTK